MISNDRPFFWQRQQSVWHVVNHQPVKVASVGDYGGAVGTLVSLSNYLTSSAITSQKASFLPSTGLVRAGDTDTAVAFRDHANHGDVPGPANDASDVVFVGGHRPELSRPDWKRSKGKYPGKGTGSGPETPGTVVGWVPVKVGNSTYFIPLMK